MSHTESSHCPYVSAGAILDSLCPAPPAVRKRLDLCAAAFVDAFEESGDITADTHSGGQSWAGGFRQRDQSFDEYVEPQLGETSHPQTTQASGFQYTYNISFPTPWCNRLRIQIHCSALLTTPMCIESGATIPWRPPHVLVSDRDGDQKHFRILAAAAPILAAAMAAVDACAPHVRLVLDNMLSLDVVGTTFYYPPASLQVLASYLGFLCWAGQLQKSTL
jgi:hypothetical protein